MTTPTPPPSPDELIQATVAWLNALLDSASADVLGVAHYWDRAQSALITAATADTVGEAVTTAARKLQIETTQARTDTALLEACAVIAADYPAWQARVEREAVYLVALARVARTARKATR
ncbi:hypothetical protein GCM10022243_48900 [Saccharothrix violaceirubra]|uniref:Uncharacterized protein n=1 Tax=Saccharothrix violaceirubra TaxID=413306 RepID=A0A7W7WUT8_9PSEU|nr:hypothetical protein [Saccharothrix violaceirubra]MBB4963768.1 hypothetical protein [Saccharothrix violaceirubra]